MASIIPGFEYDIFISYRQKDNKYDGWVTEFVDHLKLELEATFKEEISVYFDINPHDGLLETHDVDASLREKLKCLVFIPVISRTYCDPKSFAWEFEFKKFVEQASADQFGLKVNLPTGNVASRVLPVRIHELETNDLKLCESVLGGVLRGVDFVYRSAGVNRPLRANEDYLQNNLNKIYYRDQINKVANAIDEIFRSLKSSESVQEKRDIFSRKRGTFIRTKNENAKKVSLVNFKQIINRKLLFSLLFILVAVGTIIIYYFFNAIDTKKSVAILPFRCQDNESELITKGDIFTEAALIKLSKIKSLTLRSRISTSQYRDTKKTLNTIRKELDVIYLIDGSIRRDRDKIKIWIELIDAWQNKQLWSDEYVWENDQISEIVSGITRDIAYRFNAKITDEELKQIDTDPTKNSLAYLKYLSANVISNDAWNFFNTGNISMDSASFTKAICYYDTAIIYDSLFAEAYARRAIARSWGFNTRQFDTTYIEKCYKDISKALEINRNLTEAQIALGFYYYYCKTDYQKALVHFNRAADKDPANYQPLFYMALVYRRMGDWGRSQSLIFTVIRQNPQVALFLTNIGLSYNYLHKFDSAMIYHQKAIDVMPGWSAPYINKIETLILQDGRTSEARRIMDSAIENTGKRLQDLKIRLNIYDGKLKDALYETDHSGSKDFRIKGERYLEYAKIYHLLNNENIAGVYYDSALVSLNSINDVDKTAEMYGLASIAYAGKGNKKKAIEAGKVSVELTMKNKMAESDMRLFQAQVYTMLGDYENAIMNIEYLLENPSCFSPGLLHLDPVWKPLLNIPEVKVLINKYSKK
jgi:TolB-like protein/Tfp pilus assembly protein PilF